MPRIRDWALNIRTVDGIRSIEDHNVCSRMCGSLKKIRHSRFVGIKTHPSVSQINDHRIQMAQLFNRRMPIGRRGAYMLTTGNPVAASVLPEISVVSIFPVIPCSGLKSVVTFSPGTFAGASWNRTSMVRRP